MSLKFNNNSVTSVVYNNQNVNQIIYNNSSAWCRPFTYTTGTLPTGVASLTCTRGSTQEPTASTGTVSNNGTIYYNDSLYWTATASTGYTVTVTHGSSSPVTVTGNINGVNTSGVSATLSTYSITVTGSNCTITVNGTSRASGWSGIVEYGTSIVWTASTGYSFSGSSLGDTVTETVTSAGTYSHTPGYFLIYTSGTNCTPNRAQYGEWCTGSVSVTWTSSTGYAFDSSGTTTQTESITSPGTYSKTAGYVQLTFSETGETAQGSWDYSTRYIQSGCYVYKNSSSKVVVGYDSGGSTAWVNNYTVNSGYDATISGSDEAYPTSPATYTANVTSAESWHTVLLNSIMGGSSPADWTIRREYSSTSYASKNSYTIVSSSSNIRIILSRRFGLNTYVSATVPEFTLNSAVTIYGNQGWVNLWSDSDGSYYDACVEQSSSGNIIIQFRYGDSDGYEYEAYAIGQNSKVAVGLYY